LKCEQSFCWWLASFLLISSSHIHASFSLAFPSAQTFHPWVLLLMPKRWWRCEGNSSYFIYSDMPMPKVNNIYARGRGGGDRMDGRSYPISDPPQIMLKGICQAIFIHHS
jgi:hypothetical protein